MGARMKRSPQPQHRPPQDDSVDRIHGHRAGIAVLARRPSDVIRVACTRELIAEVETTLGKHADDLQIGVLDDAQIEKLAHTNQHEGLVLEARPRKWLGQNDLGDLVLKNAGSVLALDRVRNSYNIGAILRSAAFFGIDAVLLGAPAPHPGLDPNAIRVAEGGAEELALSRTTDLADTLGRLRARGVSVYGADGEGDAPALGFAFARPNVLVLGNEREGMSPRVRAQCDAILAIRGTGRVESLNVAIAASILVAELTRTSRG